MKPYKPETREEELRFFRHAMAQIPTSVAVVAVGRASGLWRGATVGSFGVISWDPAIVGFWLHSSTGMHALLTQAEGLPIGVSVLAAHQEDLAVHFAGGSQLKTVSPDAYHDRVVFEGSVLQIAGTYAGNRVDVEDHTLFLLAPEVFRWTQDHTLPLLYWQRSYLRLPTEPQGG